MIIVFGSLFEDLFSLICSTDFKLWPPSPRWVGSSEVLQPAYAAAGLLERPSHPSHHGDPASPGRSQIPSSGW
jgi:hypothetical protein